MGFSSEVPGSEAHPGVDDLFVVGGGAARSSQSTLACGKRVLHQNVDAPAADNVIALVKFTRRQEESQDPTAVWEVVNGRKSADRKSSGARVPADRILTKSPHGTKRLDPSVIEDSL